MTYGISYFQVIVDHWSAVVHDILSCCFLQADLRFLWNHYMLEVLIDNKLEPYLLPVIQGSFQNFQVEIGKEIVDVTLIARRCTRRTGI